jgi:hypothetical protein
VLGEEAAVAQFLSQLLQQQDASISITVQPFSPCLDLNTAVEIRLERAPSSSPHGVFWREQGKDGCDNFNLLRTKKLSRVIVLHQYLVPHPLVS